MENASKAFIMAAGVLIAVMIASFMMLVLRKAGRMSSEYESQRGDLELANFNSQFEYFAKEDNTYFDIMTVANMAYDVNRNNGYDASNKIEIVVMNNSNHILYQILSKEELKKNHFFKKETNDQTYMYDLVPEYAEFDEQNEKYKLKFNCIKTEYNKITGKISQMQFKKENN